MERKYICNTKNEKVFIEGNRIYFHLNRKINGRMYYSEHSMLLADWIYFTKLAENISKKENKE